MSTIPALEGRRRWRLEDGELEASLSNIAEIPWEAEAGGFESSRPSLGYIVRSCLKQANKQHTIQEKKKKNPKTKYLP
jgi:hypothetical protein